MYDVDFLPVGDEGQSGDAIAIRFTRPDTGAYVHAVIDAGFQSDGDALVQHINDWYGTDTIDLAIVTHPDGDHIGGMGTVIRELNVGTLCVHRLGARGGSSLPAAEAVDELIELAEREGTDVVEPFAGVAGYGGALTILGPDEGWYAPRLLGWPRPFGRSANDFLATCRLRSRSTIAAGPTRATTRQWSLSSRSTVGACCSPETQACPRSTRRGTSWEPRAVASIPLPLCRSLMPAAAITHRQTFSPGCLARLDRIKRDKQK